MAEHMRGEVYLFVVGKIRVCLCGDLLEGIIDVLRSERVPSARLNKRPRFVSSDLLDVAVERLASGLRNEELARDLLSLALDVPSNRRKDSTDPSAADSTVLLNRRL